MAKPVTDFLSPNFIPPWLPPAALILLCSISLFLSIRKSKPPANLPPRPPSVPIIGHLHLLGKLPHHLLRDLSKINGPVMLLRLGQVQTLIVSSPQAAKEVLRVHDAECCSRPLSRGPARLSYNLLDLAFGPYSDYWRKMRKLCMMELLTAKRVKSFRYVRVEEVDRMIRSISEASPGPVQLSERIFSLTSSTICRIAFGGSQHEWGKVQETLHEAMAMLSSFWGSDFFPYVGWILDVFTGLHSRLERVFSDLDCFFERVIEEHMSPASSTKSEHEDITDILIRLSKDETTSFHLTRNHIKAMLMDIFIGAIGTSSLAIEWAMTELARNPRVMKKVQDEIRSYIGKKPSVDESEVEKLKYLKMVVKETFRLHPPAPLLLPHESIRHCKIGGYDVFPKTRILINAWAIGRDSATWENPNEFHPERFEDNAIDFRGNNFELLPFGAGRRICPGLTMGATMVEFTLANLLNYFNWELPHGMKMEELSLEEEGGLTVHRKLPLSLVPIKCK